MPDQDGYPLEHELEFIKAYDVLKNGADGLIQHLQDIWHWPDYISVNENMLELHTGGWSGNEEIIQVLQETFFWYFYWQKSERGGHFYFTIPEKTGA